MGYKRQAKLYELVFDGPDDGEMKGFECKVRGVTMGAYLELARKREESSVDTTMDLIEDLAGNLVAWNLEYDDGTPVPVSKEAVLSEDSDFVTKIFDRWMRAIGGVEAPLDSGSNSGDRALEASLPMEAL